MKKTTFLAKASLALLATITLQYMAGCGDEASIYQEEKLAFENISSEHVDAKSEPTKQELSLSEKDSSDFMFRPLQPYGGYTYSSYPVYDYYKKPLPVFAPVAPDFAPVSYVHPFYAHIFLDPFYDFRHGRFSRHHHRDRD